MFVVTRRLLMAKGSPRVLRKLPALTCKSTHHIFPFWFPQQRGDIADARCISCPSRYFFIGLSRLAMPWNDNWRKVRCAIDNVNKLYNKAFNRQNDHFLCLTSVPIATAITSK